jgi:Na+-transporting NADH:ubiquinone oxidoreductase subunit NqrB
MEIVTPSKKDPRLYMVGVLILFLTLAQLFLGFSQTRQQIFVGFLTCALLDFGLIYTTTRKIAIPMSGIVSGLSLSLLLDSGTRLLPFVLCGALAICSKYFVQYQGKHFFNPTNFGMAIILLLGLGSVTPGYQWGGGTTALWIALSMGGMTLFRVRRLALIGSFLGFFILSALALRFIFGQSGTLSFGLMTGAPFQLFTFFMLPDPRTTPVGVKGQIGFSFATVLVDFILRIFRVDISLFLSLFIVDIFVLLLTFFRGSYGVSNWPGLGAKLQPASAPSAMGAAAANALVPRSAEEKMALPQNSNINGAETR